MAANYHILEYWKMDESPRNENNSTKFKEEVFAPARQHNQRRKSLSTRERRLIEEPKAEASQNVKKHRGQKIYSGILRRKEH